MAAPLLFLPYRSRTQTLLPSYVCSTCCWTTIVMPPFLPRDPPAAAVIASRVPLLRLVPTWISVRGPLVSSSKLSSDCNNNDSQQYCHRGTVQWLLTSPTFTNSLRCLPFILDWLPMYGAEAFEGPGVFSDDNERMRWNILSNTGRRRADDATSMATPASAVVHVMTGMTVYEKSSKSIEFKEVRRTAEKAMVLFQYQVSMDSVRLQQWSSPECRYGLSGEGRQRDLHYTNAEDGK